MSPIKTALLIAGFAVTGAANGYLFWKLDRQRTDLTSEITALRETLASEMAGLRRTVTTATRQTEESLKEQLEGARRQAAFAAGKAKNDAVRRAEELARQLSDLQQQQQQQLTGELTGLKEANSSTSARVAEVSGDVKNVRSELDKTASDLRTDLKSVQGDLGVQSGLIATNAKELATLRALGERNYFEFSLPKNKRFQSVGNIRVALHKTDAGKNKFTMTVMADDKRIEKRDKTVNEPVQFYVMGTRQPYEIVVNQVHKDRVVGYLAIPKSVELASR
jgi:chromosome segregation ATPase